MKKKRNRFLALFLVVVLLSTCFTGCAATGGKTPEEIVLRLFDAIYACDGRAAVDCMFPAMSTIYDSAKSWTTQLTGVDPEEDIASEMAEEIMGMYGLSAEDWKELKNGTTVISKQVEDTTATVRVLTTIQFEDSFDYSECYAICNRIGELWYVSALATQAPSGYEPTEQLIRQEILNIMLNNMNEKRLELVYDVKFEIDQSIVLHTGEAIDLTMLEATWKAIDEYKTIGLNHLFDSYLSENDPYPPFYFESFVLTYPEDKLLNASVTAAQLVKFNKDVFSDQIKEVFGDVDSDSVVNLLNKDQKVAQIIIDYLSELDLKSETTQMKKDIKIAKKNLKAAKKLMEADDVLRTSDLLKVLSEMNVMTANGKETCKFGDLLELTEENVSSVAKRLFALMDGAENGYLEIAMDGEWGAPLNMEFYSALKDRIRTSKTKSLYACIDEEIESASLPSKIKKVNKFLSKVIHSSEKMIDILKYQEVLDQQEVYLNRILESTGCDDAEDVVEAVLNTMNEAVAKGIVRTIGMVWSEDTVVSLLEEKTDEMVEEALEAVIGSNKINLWLLAFDLSTEAAFLLCDAANTKLKVWDVEDGYDAFQTSKRSLSEAVDEFYEKPTAKNYEKLYYAAEYYGLLVRSCSKAVSDILYQDADSWMSKFLNLFDSGKVDQRLERLAQAKQMPEADEMKLEQFMNKLFP